MHIQTPYLPEDYGPRGRLAAELFCDGYNCAQAVVLSFRDELGEIPPDVLSRIACAFGGGMGRLRETCGAFSGLCIALGLLYGYDGPETGEIKAEQYARIQKLGLAFEEKAGSLSCRTLLGLPEGHSLPEPTERTAEFYHDRPCTVLIAMAADLLDSYLRTDPPEFG